MMMDDFERAIIAARPDNYRSNVRFSDDVMNRIYAIHRPKLSLVRTLRQLPTFAVIVIVIMSVLIMSGGAYAAYRLLWQKPDVHVSDSRLSPSGRSEVDVSLAACGKNNLAIGYELKKNATITIEDVPMVIRAQCEMDIIEDWAVDALFHRDTTQSQKEGLISPVRPDISMATHVVLQTGNSMTFESNAKYDLPEMTYAVTPETRFLIDGHDISKSAIDSNDPVVYILDGSPLRKLLAVVKLSLPFRFYDQFAQQSLATRMTCMGNPADSCLTGYAATVDLYQGLSHDLPGDVEMKQIQGVITEINGRTLKIKSSSGSLFTVICPVDIVMSYNIGKPREVTVGLGSTISVLYMEEIDRQSKEITAAMLQIVTLQIEILSKGDEINKY